MSDIAANTARKQLLLTRSDLYRLRLQRDARQLRESFAAPARGLGLVRYLPVALMAIRLVARGRGGSVMPSLLGLASVVASEWLARRSR